MAADAAYEVVQALADRLVTEHPEFKITGYHRKLGNYLVFVVLRYNYPAVMEYMLHFPRINEGEFFNRTITQDQLLARLVSQLPTQ